MNKPKSRLLLNALLALALGSVAGCISYSPGVISVGPETYSVSVTGNAFTTAGDVKARAYAKANAFCESKGKVMVPVSVQSTPQTAYSCATYDLTFRALDPTDPEVQRPNLQPVPNVRVDVHNK